MAGVGVGAAVGMGQGAGPPAPPNEFSNLEWWFKADAGVTGDPVSDWADQGANGNLLTQATAANRPDFVPAAINGLPALLFDGTDDSLRDATPNPTGAGAAFSCFALVKTGASVVGPNTILCWGTTSGGAPNGIQLRVSASNLQVLESNVAVLLTGSSTLLVDTVYLMELHRASGTNVIEMFVNEVSQGTVVDGRAFEINDLTAGENNAVGGPERWNGHIGEVFWYSSRKTGADLASIRAYMDSRWAY